jgi:hypothetical protein
MTRDEVAKKLIGAWRYIGTTVDGVNRPRGNHPKGMIYYGAHGEMSVQIAPDVERKRTGAVRSLRLPPPRKFDESYMGRVLG